MLKWRGPALAHKTKSPLSSFELALVYRCGRLELQMTQRAVYHSIRSTASARVMTGTVVNSNHSIGSTPTGDFAGQTGAAAGGAGYRVPARLRAGISRQVRGQAKPVAGAPLAGFAAQGRKVVLWGSGSKGVAFLTTLNAGPEIAGVVDFSERYRPCRPNDAPGVERRQASLV